MTYNNANNYQVQHHGNNQEAPLMDFLIAMVKHFCKGALIFGKQLLQLKNIAFVPLIASALIYYSVLQGWDIQSLWIDFPKWAFGELYYKLKMHRLVLNYPKRPEAFEMYINFLSFIPVFVYCVGLDLFYTRYGIDTEKVFKSMKLQNGLGQTPKIVKSYKIDEHSRRIIYKNCGLSEASILAKKPEFEAKFKARVKNINVNILSGKFTVDICTKELPNMLRWSPLKGFRGPQAYLGESLVGQQSVDFRKVPHLLVAGQTGGGKSNLIRVLATDLMLNTEGRSQFRFVDLKGGVDASLFEGLQNTSIYTDLTSADALFENLASKLKKRLNLFKRVHVKDLSQYITEKHQANSSKFPFLPRIFVIVDEAADLFASGNTPSDVDLKMLKLRFAEIARKGRAVGIHLIVGLQRPDARNLDTTIKANLTGVICFRMRNVESSVLALGNKSAFTLPEIPGRAVLSIDGDCKEIQVPLLEPSDLENAISHLWVKSRSTDINEDKIEILEQQSKFFEDPID